MDGLPFIKLANRYGYQYYRFKKGEEEEKRGYEVIVKFRSLNITNNGIFFTDSNGLEMQRRDLNTTVNQTQSVVGKITSFSDIGKIVTGYDEHLEDNVAKHYYPVTTGIAIRDEYTQMNIVNDRAQGGSSLQNGTIELMQNRRIFADDQKGMNEPLEEYNHFDNYGIRFTPQKEYPGIGVITTVKYELEIFSRKN